MYAVDDSNSAAQVSTLLNTGKIFKLFLSKGGKFIQENIQSLKQVEKNKTVLNSEKAFNNDYITKENNFTKYHLKSSDKFQNKIYKEIIGRIKKDDKRVPYKYNGIWYITKFKKGYEYPFYYRKVGTMKAKEELLIDVNKF